MSLLVVNKGYMQYLKLIGMLACVELGPGDSWEEVTVFPEGAESQSEAVHWGGEGKNKFVT